METCHHSCLWHYEFPYFLYPLRGTDSLPIELGFSLPGFTGGDAKLVQGKKKTLFLLASIYNNYIQC